LRKEQQPTIPSQRTVVGRQSEPCIPRLSQSRLEPWWSRHGTQSGLAWCAEVWGLISRLCCLWDPCSGRYHLSLSRTPQKAQTLPPTSPPVGLQSLQLPFSPTRTCHRRTSRGHTSTELPPPATNCAGHPATATPASLASRKFSSSPPAALNCYQVTGSPATSGALDHRPSRWRAKWFCTSWWCWVMAALEKPP
jgi:hypothetical protein